ncbi:gas vesicle protein GvpJ [Mycobacterium sp. 1164985.4]|uniref:gas vesicle protein GvpJ n=1 Tax=Mycobacterium sp. 1164985.4 TaxID=1834069 RepID=UPI001E284B87|nr:gas vesicle protein GvpJ [Mycobacterium sp. 1164985.4]
MPRGYGGGGVASPQPANLGDILERVLDKGIVIAGDIQVNLLDIELLTIKLRLVVASLDTAKEVGIDWWENDPWLTGKKSQLQLENEKLRAQIRRLEQGDGQRRAVEAQPVTYEDVEYD